MSRTERWSLHLAALLTGLSGLAYGWARYFGARMGEFGPEPHPLQGLFQHAHVLIGPALVFTLGMAVRAHALPALRTGRIRGRFTGLGLTLLLAPMILSGYALQVVVDPKVRVALAWIHGPLALLFLAAYLGHFAAVTLRALQPRPSEGMMEDPSSRSSAG